MSDFKERMIAAKGDAAKRILEDPLFIAAFDDIESEILDSWRNSSAEDIAGRDNAYLMQRLLGNLKSAFTSAVLNGEFSKKKLLKTDAALRDKIKRKLNIV